MKLNDFFQEQKNQGFTDIDKLELYQKFLYKKNLGSPVRRFSFVHAKSFVYTVITAFLILGTYGVYFFNGTSDSPWFTIDSRNTAQADYIAKVVDFNGNFSIEHGGEILQTKDIGNGDSILLKSGSQMVFEISSGTKSKIIGPAKLTLQKISETAETKYRINLVYGDFIQMEGNENQQNIELAVSDMLIKQADTKKPVNFQFINNGSNHIIKNNGAPLLVSKNGNTKETKINNKQVLAMQNNDITLFKDRQTFTTEVKRGNISQTFALNTNPRVKTEVKETSGSNEESPMSFMTLLNNSDINTKTETDDETISKNISSLLNDTKQIPNEEQSKKLGGALNGGFLLDDISSAYINYVEGNRAEYDAQIKKIEDRIQQLYTSFDMSYPGKLSTAIANLEANIKTNYEVPPTYLHNLLSINAWLEKINKAGFGSAPNEGTKAWEEVLQKRSSILIFQ